VSRALSLAAAIVFIDTTFVDGYLAYLLIRSLCEDREATFIGLESASTWHVYQVGLGMRVLLPVLPQPADILSRVEHRNLMDDIN
jgi:hypothetical protein